MNSYVRVCGIYVDGDFVCAAESRNAAEHAVQNVLNSHIENTSSFQSVSFLQKIEYREGLYPENSKKLLNNNELFEFLSGKKSPLVIKQTKTVTTNTSIPFSKQTRQSDLLEKGTSKILKNGVEGNLTVTEIICYIDGKENSRVKLAQKVTKQPQAEIVLEGTKVYSAEASGYTWPTQGAYYISSYYGNRDAEISGWSFHGGIDIIEENGNSTGLPVIAAAAGTVENVSKSNYDYGHSVVINHGNGIRTRYAHMTEGSICVSVGEKIDIGEKVGLIGSTGNTTGPHLHFELIINGTKVDPLPFINGKIKLYY